MADFRNTITAVWSSFYNHLKTLKGQLPPDGRQAIREVFEGEVVTDTGPVPFLTVQFKELKPVSRTETDKQKLIKVAVKVVTSVVQTDDATAEILSKIAMVDNVLDTWTRPSGVTGLENPHWGVIFWTSADHGNLVAAQCELEGSVMVGRGAN